VWLLIVELLVVNDRQQRKPEMTPMVYKRKVMAGNSNDNRWMGGGGPYPCNVTYKQRDGSQTHTGAKLELFKIGKKSKWQEADPRNQLL